jgi:integrase/ribosomal protein L40E
MVVEDKMGRITQGDYRFDQKIAGSRNRLRDLVDRDVFQILEKYDKAMVMDSLADASKAKNFDTILGLTRLLPEGKSWLELEKDDIENLVVAIMNKYSDNGKENSVTADFKRFLKIWYRFIKFGSRSFKKVGDPIETRDIVTRKVEVKLERLQLISPQEKKKLVDACTNLRDKALIDSHWEAGTRIGEILSVQIKHVKIIRFAKGIYYELAVDGKTGARVITVKGTLNETLGLWLESHPDKTNAEAFLFPSLKHVYKGNKLSYAAAMRVLKTACKAAGIRPLYWHLFRHSEATRAAQTMPEALMKKRHGWSATSKMASRYAHVTNEDANRAYLKTQGIDLENTKDQATKPLICRQCEAENSYDRSFCIECGNTLTTEMTRILVKETNKAIPTQEEIIEKIMPFVMEKIQSTYSITPSMIENMTGKQAKKLLSNFVVNQ